MTAASKTIWMEQSTVENTDAFQKSASQLGFWLAVLTAVLAAVAFAFGIATPAKSSPIRMPT